MISDANPGQLAVPAVISFVAALISPVLALTRWIQERSTKHRYRDEIDHAQELSSFIQHCPEYFHDAGSADDGLLDHARNELKKSLAKIQTLLKQKATREAPPAEMAWPRRWLLFYAPRSGWATLLHAWYQLALVFFAAFLVAISYNEDLDTFQLLRITAHPFLLAILAVWVVRLGLIWYVSVTKDRWDGAVPEKKIASKVFLRQPPASVRELLARLLLIWSVLDIVARLFLKSEVFTRDWSSLIASSPEAATLWDNILKAIPSATAWERIASWLAALLTIYVSFMWSSAEPKARGETLWLPFPHQLRFLYPSKGWREYVPQIAFVFVIGFSALQVYWLQKDFGIIWPLLPDDAKDGYLLGLVLGNVETVFFSFVTLYACYRVGLLSYISRESGQKAFASTSAS